MSQCRAPAVLSGSVSTDSILGCAAAVSDQLITSYRLSQNASQAVIERRRIVPEHCMPRLRQ